MSDVCSSCNAPIVWALTERGKRMPVDAEPVEDGNVLLSHRGWPGAAPVAIVQGPLEIEQLRIQHERTPQQGPLRLFTSHFATCPDADQHRKGKR
jgi:hypothetical protein